MAGGAPSAARRTLLQLPHTRISALRALAAGRTSGRGTAMQAAAAAAGGESGTGAAGDGINAAPSRPKVLILTGPTAVGKTKTSLALAEALGGEIVSADSVQVYRGLDVGSDKVGAGWALQNHAAVKPGAEAWCR